MNYCTLDQVKAYGSIARAVKDAVINEQLIPAASGRIDDFCRQGFGHREALEQVVQALVAVDGVLRTWPPTPHVATLTALEYRNLANCEVWQAAKLDLVSVENRQCGAVITAFGDYAAHRGQALQVRLTGAWGYDLEHLPQAIRHNCVRLVHWFLHQPDAPFGKAGNAHTGEWQVPAGLPEDVRQGLAAWRATVR